MKVDPMLRGPEQGITDKFLFLFQLCPANLVGDSLMIFEMDGNLSCSRCFVGCFFQVMFRTTRCMRL